jgi:hypothetical protein
VRFSTRVADKGDKGRQGFYFFILRMIYRFVSVLGQIYICCYFPFLSPCVCPIFFFFLISPLFKIIHNYTTRGVAFLGCNSALALLLTPSIPGTLIAGMQGNRTRTHLHHLGFVAFIFYLCRLRHVYALQIHSINHLYYPPSLVSKYSRIPNHLKS